MCTILLTYFITFIVNVEAQKTPVARRDLLDAVEKNLAYWTERQSSKPN